MKKQILAYRREIIELSSSKKYHTSHGYHTNGNNNNHQNSKSEGRRVPRLDLSKLHRDSDDGNGNLGNHPEGGGGSCNSIHNHEGVLMDEQ